MTEIRVAAHLANELGEGPCWVAEESALYWVDIFGRSIHRLDIRDGSTRTWRLEEPVGFIAPCAGDKGFLVGLQSGIHSLHLSPFRLEPLCDPEHDDANTRFNDGKVDAGGNLWAGTMDLQQARPTGALYRFDRTLDWVRVDDGYLGTNGPAFSPDGRTLYHADSPRRLIYRIVLDETGKTIEEKSVFLEFEDPAWGEPDGMTTDRDGCLWLAHWDGGRISRFDPSGKLMSHIRMPASRITSCAFGGPDLDRLFVTSARFGRHEEPAAGALFEVETDTRGNVSTRFGGAV